MATTFTNQATLSYNGSTVQSNVAVGILEGVLTVSKYSLSDVYAAGDTLTYVISIVNNGDTAVSGLTVTDDLGAYIFNTGTVQPLSYVDGSVQYYRDGVLQPDPAVATTAGLAISGISIPDNGNAVIIYQAQVNEFAPLDTAGTIENTVLVTGTDVCNVSDTETVTALSEAMLSVVKSITPIPVSENGELSYTFQLQNSGNIAVAEADNAVISDTFDPALTDIRVTLNGTALAETTDYTYDEATGAFATTEGTLSIPAATFEQDADTGAWTMTPGSATLIVTGTVGTMCDLANVEKT